MQLYDLFFFWVESFINTFKAILWYRISKSMLLRIIEYIQILKIYNWYISTNVRIFVTDLENKKSISFHREKEYFKKFDMGSVP